MRDEARAFHRKHEILRRCVVPCLPTARRLQGIERAVDLDRIESVRGEFQFPALHESLRIKHAAPWPIAPAGNTDIDGCTHAGQLALRIGMGPAAVDKIPILNENRSQLVSHRQQATEGCMRLRLRDRPPRLRDAEIDDLAAPCGRL